MAWLTRIVRQNAGPRKNARGTVALEFALVSPILFMIVFGLIELAIMTVISLQLTDAATVAGRAVRIGDVQQSGTPQATFQSKLCDELGIVIDCDDADYSVEVHSGYDEIEKPVQLDTNGDLLNTGYENSGGGDVVTVRVAHRYNFTTPIIGQFMGQGGDNSRLLIGTRIFTTEPFED